jgi:shikimate dehydrogenase
VITGNTKLFGIVADPIAQVRTPESLNAYFKQEGLDAVLVPMHVSPEGLPAMFEAFRRMRNLGGFIATVPHKTDALDLCDEVTESARAIGAVNTVRREADGRLVGDMFDGRGFVEGLTSEGHDLAGRSVLLVGAGGAAAAIAHALAQAGVGRLSIANRTHAKAQAMADRVSASLPGAIVDAVPADPRGYDIVVNATSLGMKEGDDLPLDVSRLSPSNLVAEIIMKPEMTALLYEAQSRGCRIHQGCHMLDHQVRLMGRFMTGQSID